jgi:hypothetical protein
MMTRLVVWMLLVGTGHVVAQSVTWGVRAVSPWAREPGVVRLVTADPLAHELAGLQYDIGWWMMKELRAHIAEIGVDEGLDARARRIVEVAASDGPMEQFRGLLIETRWIHAPTGLRLPPEAVQPVGEWLRAAELLWGQPESGGCGWLRRLVSSEDRSRPEVDSECLVPRIVDPLAFEVASAVPGFLRRPPEIALEDPRTALGSVNELAQLCRAKGARNGARGAAWACLAAMSSRSWMSSAEAYPGLIAVRAESVLAISLLVRSFETEGLVGGVPGGMKAAPRPEIVVLVTDQEFDALGAWCGALQAALAPLGRGDDERRRWVEMTNWHVDWVRETIRAVRVVRDIGHGGEGVTESVVGQACMQIEDAQFAYSGSSVRNIESCLADTEYWPEEWSDSWVAVGGVCAPVHKFSLKNGGGGDPWCGGAPRYLRQGSGGTLRPLW